MLKQITKYFKKISENMDSDIIILMKSSMEIVVLHNINEFMDNLDVFLEHLS